MNNATTVFLLTAAVASSAFAVRFNPDLTKMDENRAAIRAVLADPQAKPSAKLWAKYDDLKWDLYTCEDKDFPAKKAAMLKLITERGDLEKGLYVDFLYGLGRENLGPVQIPDLWPILDRETKGEPKLRLQYYLNRLAAMRRAVLWRGTYNPAYSVEARLKLIDEMEKDPAVDRSRFDFAGNRFECWVDLGDRAKIEEALQTGITATNVPTRLKWLAKGADYYKAQAERYYAEPDPATLRKVVAFCDLILATDYQRKDARALSKAAYLKADSLCRIGDVSGARAALVTYATFCKDGKLTLDGAKVLFDVCSAEKKWVEAADALTPFAKDLDAEWNVKCAQALAAAGRRREALPFLEAASKKCRNKYKRDGYDYLLKKYRAEFGEAK